MHEKIPEMAIGRLSLYFRFLKDLEAKGIDIVSSKGIARQFGYTDTQVRKDLSYFGQFGVAAKGYDVVDLRRAISRILGTDREWQVALVGVGNLGAALLSYQRFRRCGFHITAAFDNDLRKIGKRLEDIMIQDINELEAAVHLKGIKIGVITVPPGAAQEVADRLIRARIKAILNFSPTTLVVPEDVKLRHVDLSAELESLSFFLTNPGRLKGEGRKDENTGQMSRPRKEVTISMV